MLACLLQGLGLLELAGSRGVLVPEEWEGMLAGGKAASWQFRSNPARLLASLRPVLSVGAEGAVHLCVAALRQAVRLRYFSLDASGELRRRLHMLAANLYGRRLMPRSFGGDSGDMVWRVCRGGFMLALACVGVSECPDALVLFLSFAVLLVE